jgi:hypothetical protein
MSKTTKIVGMTKEEWVKNEIDKNRALLASIGKTESEIEDLMPTLRENAETEAQGKMFKVNEGNGKRTAAERVAGEIAAAIDWKPLEREGILFEPSYTLQVVAMAYGDSYKVTHASLSELGTRGDYYAVHNGKAYAGRQADLILALGAKIDNPVVSRIEIDGWEVTPVKDVDLTEVEVVGGIERLEAFMHAQAYNEAYTQEDVKAD